MKETGFSEDKHDDIKESLCIGSSLKFRQSGGFDDDSRHMSVGDMIPLKEYHKLKSWYDEQITRRDTEIDRLKEENKALVNSMFKQAQLKVPPKQREDNFFGKQYRSTISKK